MQQLIFATNNSHKVTEVKTILTNIKIKSLQEAGIIINIEEPHDTLEKNASEKSLTIYNLTGLNCFGEDTGLEVDALNGEPGVRSARYADNTSFKDNIDKLLFNMEGKTNRNSQFRTIISLILNGSQYEFEGICKGIILAQRRGRNGFGYDAVFVPNGSSKTFAEMNIEEKNMYSHRKKALEKLVEFLNGENEG